MVELVDHDKRSSTRYFCLGAFCVLFGCVLLCALGFTVVYPYHLTRDWPNVTCHVTNVTYHYDICSCGQPYGENGECFGKYPCLQIGVKYNSTEKDMERSATLFRYWSDVFYGKVSRLFYNQFIYYVNPSSSTKCIHPCNSSQGLILA